MTTWWNSIMTSRPPSTLSLALIWVIGLPMAGTLTILSILDGTVLGALAIIALGTPDGMIPGTILIGDIIGTGVVPRCGAGTIGASVLGTTPIGAITDGAAMVVTIGIIRIPLVRIMEMEAQVVATIVISDA